MTDTLMAEVERAKGGSNRETVTLDNLDALTDAALPGPWEATEWRKNIFVHGGPNNDDIAEFNFEDEHTVKITREQAVAHSKLFASIPRLTAALRASLAREKAMREALERIVVVGKRPQIELPSRTISYQFSDEANIARAALAVQP